MNPSSTGWINKHFPALQKQVLDKAFSKKSFYLQLQQTGFIYAHSTKTLSYSHPLKIKWTLEELTKINLFDALAYVYYSNFKSANREEFTQQCIQFYKLLEKETTWKGRFTFFKSKPEETLEKIIQHRIQINDSFFQKNFSHLITNALLFLDVLAFNEYLIHQKHPKNYLTNLESLITNVVILAFQKKTTKDKYENLVVKLLESSLRYHKIQPQNQPFETINFESFNSHLERKFILDLASITIYSDEEIEKKEYAFIEKLGNQLHFSAKEVDENITQMLLFLKQHKNEISYFNYTNAIQHFYKNTNRMVKVLILRNKNRLLKEIFESKELVMLLSKSTHKDLSEEEKHKVKEQLLDICKTIPSLAIFILPGGSILLPILIKFIPQLLPSSFNENRIKK
ncbi:LETM1-related biofilm-associated protein [Mesonia aestuariivivens]|uniref:LETM1 domain-containing protein n=1 Tax=Mesonia aestuariivivens TaxID=2796128 RepID=A0ABS6W0P5_9FLAO|nr:LETM1-related biofilm-associated protein [Mesonia aestuariivivens]MBW2961426.1 LETM1 domain-containing protein [Mesonia aestuariivivens]